MNDVRAVWLVGELCHYHDYPDAVFTTKAAAEEHVAAKANGKPEHEHGWWVEELPLDPPLPTSDPVLYPDNTSAEGTLTN